MPSRGVHSVNNVVPEQQWTTHPGGSLGAQPRQRVHRLSKPRRWTSPTLGGRGCPLGACQVVSQIVASYRAPATPINVECMSAIESVCT